ncbi:hypothetical protein BH23ACT6_BH23ACT6_06390 [soil metagenome]
MLAGTLRVLAHPRVFDPSVTPERACAAIDHLVGHPGVVVVTPLAGFWVRLRDLVQRTKVKGNLVADAAHAVVAMQHGAT